LELREYIKGLKLRTSPIGINYEGYYKDAELLRLAGAGELFDFTESDLQKPDPISLRIASESKTEV
jgi:hypothetical protein